MWQSKAETLRHFIAHPLATLESGQKRAEAQVVNHKCAHCQRLCHISTSWQDLHRTWPPHAVAGVFNS